MRSSDDIDTRDNRYQEGLKDHIRGLQDYNSCDRLAQEGSDSGVKGLTEEFDIWNQSIKLA